MVFVAGDEGLEIAGYDYEVSTQIRIAAEISETGRFAVNGKLVSDIVSKLPNKPIDMHYDGTKVLVTCGKSRFELPAMTLEDYPALPSVPAATGTIDPQLFTEAIGQVAVAAGRDETLPMLTGIRMETEGNMVTMAATDRFRLASHRCRWGIGCHIEGTRPCCRSSGLPLSNSSSWRRRKSATCKSRRRSSSSSRKPTQAARHFSWPLAGASTPWPA